MSQIAAQEKLIETREAEPVVPQGTSAALAAMLKGHVPVKDGQFSPDSLEGYQRLAEGYLKAGLVPDGLVRGVNDWKDKIARVSLVLEAGMGGLKLTAIQSMSYLMVVNNRVCVWGDAIPGLIQRSGCCAGIEETQAKAGADDDSYAATCTMKRMNRLPDGSFVTYQQARVFSIKDAKRASLWGKSGPWSNYPQRMLQIRARAFAARDMFPDALMGLAIVEEMQDIETSSLKEARERTATLNPAPVANGTHKPETLVPTRKAADLPTPKFAGMKAALAVEPAEPIAPGRDTGKPTSELTSDEFVASLNNPEGESSP